MLRKTLGKSIGAVVLGLSLAEDVQAQDTGYLDLTHGETLQVLTKKVEKVSYQSFDEEIKKYDGAVIMLATNTCPSAEGEPINRNMEIVYLQLRDKFADAKVNNLPLKFTWFDTCGRSGADLLGITGLETHMYLDGQKIDVRVGGPLDITNAEANVKVMSAWINSNLLKRPYVSKKGDDKKILFYGQFDPTMEPYKP